MSVGIGRGLRCLALLVLLVPVQGAFADDALFRALGGKEKIARFSSELVDIALKDDRIKAKFADANIRRLKHLIAVHICNISGGPCVYRGRTMAASHAKLGLHNADFNALVEDLETAMDHAGIPFYTQNKLLAILAPMQRDIVTK